MLPDEFNKRIRNLEDKTYKTEFDISSYFLSEKEIVKNIIRSKNPNMSKEDINLMVHGPGYTASTTGATSSSTQTKTTNEYSPYPLPDNSPYHQESRKHKDEIRKSSMLFMHSKKELINQLSSSLTLLSSSIPAIAMMVSTIPWNVPAALSLAALVLDSLNDLIGKSVKLILYLGPLKYLQLVLSESSLKMVIKLLNPAISVVMAILDPIEKIKKFILTIIEKIKSLFQGDNCRKQIKRIKKQLRKKNIELVKLKAEKVAATVIRNTSKADSIQEDIDDVENDISDLNQQLGEMEKRCGKKTDLEQDLEQLNTLVEEVNTESETWIENLTYETVYDVLLPDGTTINGLNDEQLENLKKDYTILFNE